MHQDNTCNLYLKSKGRIPSMLVELQNPRQKPMPGASQDFDLSIKSDWIFCSLQFIKKVPSTLPCLLFTNPCFFFLLVK